MGFPNIIKRYGLIALLIVLPGLARAENAGKKPAFACVFKSNGGVMKTNYTDGSSAIECPSLATAGRLESPGMKVESRCVQKQTSSNAVCPRCGARKLAAKTSPSSGRSEVKLASKAVKQP